MARQNVVPIQFNVPPEVREQITKLAEAEDLEVSAFLQFIVQEKTGLKWEVTRAKKRRKSEDKSEDN